MFVRLTDQGLCARMWHREHEIADQIDLTDT